MMRFGEKYLITTDAWFIGPDSKQYRAVWGTVELFEDNQLGITTNRNSSNWYAKVGGNGKEVIIAGCQIHYAVRMETKPETGNFRDYEIHEGKITFIDKPSSIYIAE